LIELSHLYNEVAELVHQQEPAVQQIQQSAEETHGNVKSGVGKIDTAIQSAKNARRWKWYALIIIREYLPVCADLADPLTYFPVIIIGIVVGVAVGVSKANQGGGN
jgi:syntaxin 1B/2/3